MERRAIAESPTSPNRDNEDSSSDGSARPLIPVGGHTGQISHAGDQPNPEVRLTNLDTARDGNLPEVSSQPSAHIQAAEVRHQVQQRNPDIPLPRGHEDRHGSERVFTLVATIVSCIGVVKQRPSQKTDKDTILWSSSEMTHKDTILWCSSEMTHKDTILWCSSEMTRKDTNLWYGFWGCMLAQLVLGTYGFLLLRRNGRIINRTGRIMVALAFCAAGSALILLAAMELPDEWKLPLFWIIGAVCFPGFFCTGY